MSNNIYQFQTEEQIYEEASLWVTRLDRGLSEAETQALRRWLELNPRNKECLLEMADLWDRMDSLSVLSELFDPPVPYQQESQQQESQPSSQKTRGMGRTVWAVAASVLALVFAFNLLVPATPWLAPTPTEQSRQANTETSNTLYETGIGVHSTVNLPDGTRMLLNTNTRVSVTYSDNERLLVLKKGELHVEVAHDKSRPLRVQVGGKVVEAVGTAFNVYLRDEQNFDVIVTEGRVQVKPLAEKTSVAVDEKNQTGVVPRETVQELGRGEKLSVRASQPAAVESIAAAVINDRLSWRDGNLVFRGETLQVALSELGRYTSDSFKVIDPRINDVRIAGLYKAGDVDGLLLALKENFNIHHLRTSDGVIELSLEPTARH
jgi:transmembrane sensor